MTNNKVVIVCTLAWLLALPLIIVAQHDGLILFLLDIANALGFVFGWLVIWRYSPGALIALRDAMTGRRLLGRGAMLVLGIVKTWLAMVIRTCAIWWWRWLNEPDGGLDSIPMAIAAFLIISGGACHIAASGMKEDVVEVPRLSTRLIWIALITGLVLGVAIASARWSNVLRAVV